MNKQGLFVVLYGVNNIGKTTQLDLLEERAKAEGLKLFRLKYPVYDLAPTGPQIHAITKGGNPEGKSATELQELNAQNRFDFQPTLEEKLREYDIVLAEMYVGTSVAFGVAQGVPKDYLLQINEGLRTPDVSLLLYGTRFKEAVEVGHRFEENDEMMNRIAVLHDELAKESGWTKVNANRDREVITDEIWCEIEARRVSS